MDWLKKAFGLGGGGGKDTLKDQRRYLRAQCLERIMVVMVSSSLNHKRVSLRERITTELLNRWGVRTERVEARGSRPLEQVLSATYFGDFVSYYLALINDIDPSDIDVINYLKQRLAQEP